MTTPPILDVKINQDKCGRRWDKEGFCDRDDNQGIRKAISLLEQQYELVFPYTLSFC